MEPQAQELDGIGEECDCGCGSCHIPTQKCPVCRERMGDLPGLRDAVCKNCGFKPAGRDPCCE